MIGGGTSMGHINYNQHEKQNQHKCIQKYTEDGTRLKTIMHHVTIDSKSLPKEPVNDDKHIQH